MKRILAVTRGHGGHTDWVESLAPLLEPHGFELVVDQAESWIPNPTGWRHDREVTKRLKAAVRGFDAVHAIGYRAAWACSEAFYLRFPWVYTAWDFPRTTHAHLVDRLNAARAGHCVSRAVKEALDEAEVLSLIRCAPGVPAPRADEGLRRRLGVAEGEFLIFSGGEPERDSGRDELETAMAEVWDEAPHAVFAVLSIESASPELRIFRSSSPHGASAAPEPLPALCAEAELTVDAGLRRGFSRTGALAMHAGRCALLRRAGGLGDMAVDGISAFFFSDGDLARRILAIAREDSVRTAVASGARARAEERFEAAEQARLWASHLKQILD